MTTLPCDESIEEPEQCSAIWHSLSGLIEVSAEALQEQKTQQTTVMPFAPPVNLWRSLMLEQ
ncbi:hypothetical protein C4E44_18625 [Pseudomonas sp. MWU12-2312b]|nr:hypothetical protein C4E44_18625 [Pseudomonas sp. MWU12-2312b]